MKKALHVLTLTALLAGMAFLASRVHFYRSNYLRQDSWVGVALDNAGGIELYNGRPAMFLCPMNPVAPFFPDLVADC